MELENLFKNSTYLIISRIGKFLSGIVRSKLVAIYLGPLGAGITSQLSQITTSMYQFSVLSMNDGLIKEIAQSDKDDKCFNKKLPVLLKSYIFILAVACILNILIALYFSREITKYVFGDQKYYGYFLIGLASFPILIINSISFAILRGFKVVKFIARSEMIVILLNLIVLFPLIYFWGITGAAIHIALSLLFLLLFNHYYARKKILKQLNISAMDIFRAKIDMSYVKELLRFAVYGLTAGMVEIFTEVLTRSFVVSHMGIDQIGIYSPVMYWSSLFTGFIFPSIITYLYPRLSESKSNGELSAILNDSIRFITLLMVPFVLISIPIRYIIIPLFYSHEFVSAGVYLPWHLMGNLFYLWIYIFMQAMIATGRLKKGGTIVILISLLDIIVVYFLVPRYGLNGWMLKFIISPVIFFVFYIFYFRRIVNFKLDNKNVLLMGYLMIAFVILMSIEKYLTANWKINSAIGVLLTFITLLILQKNERQILFAYVSKLIRKLPL